MSRTRVQILLDLVCIPLLLSPAVVPLLRPAPTCGWDNLLHLWRAVEVERFLSNGLLFSRWAPDMARGYGYPLFNFIAPASAYGPAVLHLMGIPWPLALNLTFALSWILSAIGMYVFTRDLFDRRAGLVAGAIYAFVPFHAYDVFYRGSLSQSTAWIFPPFILWGLRRADKRRGFATAVTGLAGLILTHNAFALLFAPLVLAYVLMLGVKRGKRTLARGVLAFLTALSLTAFFWVPALAELQFVHSERIAGDWVFVYTNNFLPPRQLLPISRTAYSDLINDWPERGLGVVPALLATLGLAALIASRRWMQASLWGITFASSLFLTSTISRPIWEAIPILQHVQFPWRLIGPAAFCAATLGAALMNILGKSNDRLGSAVTLLLILVAVIPHLGWLYPRHCDPPTEISVSGMIRFEEKTGTIGTTALGEFLPIWVQQMPPGIEISPHQENIPGCGRFDHSFSPEGTILRSECEFLGAVIMVDAPADLEARYKVFFYPGWHVWIDEQPTQVVPSDPEGWLSFEIPPGRHTVRIGFAETMLRRVVDSISIITIPLFLVMLVRWKNSTSEEVTS